MKASFWISLLAVQALLLLTDCCGPQPPAHFRRTSLMVRNVVLDGSSQYSSPSSWTGDTAIWPAESYGVGLDFTVQYISQATRTGGNHAYADAFFSCSTEEPGRDGSHEQITAFSVTSTSAFDSAHAAGASLNDLFYLQEYQQAIPLDSVSMASAPNLYTRWAEDLVLHLRQRPTHDSTFVFHVKVQLSDGTQFEGSSPRVTFRR